MERERARGREKEREGERKKENKKDRMRDRVRDCGPLSLWCLLPLEAYPGLHTSLFSQSLTSLSTTARYATFTPQPHHLHKRQPIFSDQIVDRNEFASAAAET